MACPFSYKAHYIDRIRPIKTGSPLVNGSGIDAALNAVLEGKSDEIALADFRKAFEEVPLGDMVPHPLDYDGELFTEEQATTILNGLRQFGFKGDNPDALASALLGKVKDRIKLSENQERALDYLCRASLEAKARLMLVAYRKNVLPYIKKVYNIQKQSGPGVLDATVEWLNRGKVIVDHKTAGKFYPDNAIEYSAQLAMYAAEEKISSVCFVVLNKAIKKNREKVCEKCGAKNTSTHKSCPEKVDGVRCDGDFLTTISPECEIQILHGEVTPEMIAVADELQREVQRAVDANIFPCNVAQCNNTFGKPCVYRDLKWKGSMVGLKKLT